MKNSLVVVSLIIVILLASAAGYSFAPYKTTTIHPPTLTLLTVTTTIITTAFVTKVTTITNSSSSTFCSATGGIGCPHFFNLTYTISVNYTGSWGLSYQGYLESDNSLIEDGNFYGHGQASEAITVSGTDTAGIKTCVQAQKLDSSSSTLVVSFISPKLTNQTSSPYGTASICLADVIM